MKYLTSREKRSVFYLMREFFNNECVRCRGESDLANVEIDHIVPAYQGGHDMPYNYQPLCARCNCSKGPETTDHRVLYCADNGLTMPKQFTEEFYL